MRKLLGWLFVFSCLSLDAMAQCTGAGGYPFNCVGLPAPPQPNDLFVAGSLTQQGLGGGKGTGSWTLAQVLGAGTTGGSFATLNVAGSALFGTGSISSPPYGFQAAYNSDPSTASGNTRNSIFNTTLSYASSTTNIWENFSSFLYLNGPGTATGEINLAHTYFQVNSGAHSGTEENYEASALNNGVVGLNDSYLALFHNGSAGTASNVSSFQTYLTNDNTTPGSIGEWDAINIGVMQGAGSMPTFYNAMRIADLNAGIVTLGGINIGNLGNAFPGRLTIHGLDNSSGTFPFVFTNLAGNVFVFDDAGNALFQAAGAVIGPNTSGIIKVTAPDNTTGHFSFALHNLAGTNLFSVDNAGVIVVGTTPGVSCPSITAATVVVVSGIVTHC